MKNKVKYDCDCIYIIINGCVYENDPYEDCKMCKGRGWYLGEKDEIQYSRKASYYNLCYSLYIFVVFNIKIGRKEMKEIIEEIEETLRLENKTFLEGGEQDKIIQGWIEGLEYALRVIKTEK